MAGTVAVGGGREPCKSWHEAYKVVEYMGLTCIVPVRSDLSVQYVGEAWGWESREYVEALVRNKEHQALQRFTPDILRQAIQLLRRYRLFRAYFGSDEEPQWLKEALEAE